jgi:glycosyltransferase involved in cell wall biosynthesis
MLSAWVKEYTCVSRDMETWLKDKIKIKRPLTQIYNGIDTRTFTPDGSSNENRLKLGLNEKDILIGVVGRLDPIKNHAMLFKTFERINSDNSNVKLLVVGDGPERKSLEHLAGNGVHFLGNRADVPDILRTLDIFTLPSINEGISNTILEAMATGLPVVATNVGGNPEIIDDGKTGQLVPSGDPAALGAALSDYIKSPQLRASHGSQGRIRVEELFSIEKMVSEYESVYLRVANRE